MGEQETYFYTLFLLSVTKKGNAIKLKMGHNSDTAVGPYVHSPSKTHTLYIGGVPGEFT